MGAYSKPLMLNDHVILAEFSAGSSNVRIAHVLPFTQSRGSSVLSSNSPEVWTVNLPKTKLITTVWTQNILSVFGDKTPFFKFIRISVDGTS